ncbi:hypothetical protein [Streptomyces californicus]|uniref:hypothetical protein n=1 Tax=Streptomyces californicus TaxID=67351 RepID=UPI0035E37FE4
MTTYGPAPIDLLNDSPAVRDYKAGAGWLWYALRNAGMTDEQIANSLATYDESVRRVALEERLCIGCGDPRDNGKAHGYGAEFGGCV